MKISNSNKFMGLLAIALAISLGFNLQKTIEMNLKNKELRSLVKINLQRYVSEVVTDIHKDNGEELYFRKCAAIGEAAEALEVLTENKSISLEEQSTNLSALLHRFKRATLYDSGKVIEFFNNEPEATKLFFNISYNLEDKESIEELYNLIEKYNFH